MTKYACKDEKDNTEIEIQPIGYMPEAVFCESTGDFSLPEYMPEIGKMLKVEPRILSTGRYIGADRAEFSGSVVYSVLYTGEDGEPFYTTLSGDYEYTVPLGEASDAERVEIYDETSLDSISVRASGPRRISVRARIKAQPHIMYEKKDGSQDAYRVEDESYQVLEESYTERYHRHFESGELELSDVFSPSSSPDIEPIGCDGWAVVSEIVFSNNAVICRGDAEYRVLYFDVSGGERRLHSTKKKLRFEHATEISGVCAGAGARATARVISAEMSRAEGQSDISITIRLNIIGELTTEKKRSYVCDVYSCTHELDVEKKTHRYRSGGVCKNFNFSYHAQKKFPEGMAVSDVCASYGEAKIESVEMKNGVAHVCGSICVDCILMESVGGSHEYSCLSVPMPFKCELALDGASEEYELSIVPEVSGVRVRMDRDCVSADAELYLCTLISGVESRTIVDKTEVLRARPARPSAITVYYPDKGESLWSVCKKYSVSLASVRSVNEGADIPSAADGTLDGVGRILIV